MAQPFSMETGAVQQHTVFGNAPYLKLSLEGYMARCRRTIAIIVSARPRSCLQFSRKVL